MDILNLWKRNQNRSQTWWFYIFVLLRIWNPFFCKNHRKLLEKWSC